MEDNKKQKTEEISNANGGVFSAQLGALINSTLQNGILTKQEIVLILSNRLAVMQQEIECNNISLSSPSKSDIPVLENPVFDACEEGVENERYVEIPEGYTEIADSSFYGGKVQHIIFPSTMKRIGIKAFAYCEKLEQIDFSKCTELLEIEDKAFSHCSKLEEIALPDSVTIIGDETFSDSELRKIVMPASLEKLGDRIFSRCNWLEEIDMSKVTKLTTIPKGFVAGDLKQMVIPMGVTTIVKAAISSCCPLFLPPTLKEFLDSCYTDHVYLFAPPLEKLDNMFENINNLYVLPQYLEEYRSIYVALGEYGRCIIHPMPDEYLYFYDN
jgi:hypothetical protein